MQINVDGAMGENCVEYRKFGIDSKFVSIIKNLQSRLYQALAGF